MKLSPMPAHVAGSSPANLQAHPNRMAAGASASPPAWTRGRASDSSPQIAGRPKPHGAGPRHAPGSHGAVSSRPQPMPMPMPAHPSHAAAPAHAAEAPVPTSPGVGTRLAHAFETTKEDLVENFKQSPIQVMFNPVKSVVATIATFVFHVFRPAK